MPISKRSRAEVTWLDEKTRESFYKLKDSFPLLFKQINKALDDIEENSFCSILIPRRLIPKKWKEYQNLWKYDLPQGWRLFYTISPPDKDGEIIILAVVLEWMNHKNYERLFKY